MKELFHNKKALIIVAHPDDELLGLGGTIHRLKNNFNTWIGVLILGEGLTSREKDRDTKKWSEELKNHRKNTESAKKILGYDELILHSFPDNRFDSVDLLDIIKIIEETINKYKPDLIFTHHEGDLNIDHQFTFNAVITATRPLQNNFVNSIFTFETPSSSEWQFGEKNKRFNPNFFIEIEEKGLKNKINAMNCYDYEKRKYPHPRSSEALTILAKQRGLQIGRKLAEAFILIRTII